MTSVAFHFNAPGKLAYACRLLRKAAASGSTVAVLADDTLLAKLDELLWSFSALDFVPHGRVQHLAEPTRQHTPIWLCDTAEQGQGRQVLVNLMHSVPAGFEGFGRVIEVVSQDEADKQSARLRWKHYSERGIQIVRHDLNLVA
ncbi:DNA polymerase III subunit chi [Variovorax sp. PCZ-1]|uniref:DNA polymerase III subunit chi n=1 Tax=Variovorax sp. PCZ-1 TaxID=2835533 RepID=UPI001BCC9281|nr:DNA polymerase III subunit chi [Variovorax sp. PCZ-1]MBS7807632.1 DNA polymerase III subunit chi [Variovorax sp. PCZ-1]